MTGVSGGGLSQTDADALYAALAGAIMVGDLTLDGVVMFLKALTRDAYIKLDGAPGVDHAGSGTILNAVVGENVSIGDVVYFKSDGKWWKADADTAATMPGLALIAIAASADAGTDMIIEGVFRDDSWNFTVGALLYTDVTPGPPTMTSPSGSGDQVQVLGIALSADIVLFNPSPVLVEVA